MDFSPRINARVSGMFPSLSWFDADFEGAEGFTGGRF
jgi:hypothetical protein